VAWGHVSTRVGKRRDSGGITGIMCQPEQPFSLYRSASVIVAYTSDGYLRDAYR
jgi:hypothetical protein